jgi:hypothetical protein
LLEVKSNMFVNNEITDRGLLHKLLSKEARTVTMDERTSWARSLDHAIEDAFHPSTPVRIRLTRPSVVASAAPALTAVAAMLRDERIDVSREALAAVREFLTDGIDSPLFGRDPLAAHRAADELRGIVSAGARAARSREFAHAHSS